MQNVHQVQVNNFVKQRKIEYLYRSRYEYDAYFASLDWILLFSNCQTQCAHWLRVSWATSHHRPWLRVVVDIGKLFIFMNSCFLLQGNWAFNSHNGGWGGELKLERIITGRGETVCMDFKEHFKMLSLEYV